MKTLAEKLIFTYDDIERLPEGNYEIIDGERYDMTPASFEHGDLEGKFYKLLTRHLESKGHIAVGEVGVLISKKNLKPFGCFCPPLTIRKPVLNSFEIIPRLLNLAHLKVCISCKIHDLRNMTTLRESPYKKLTAFNHISGLVGT